MSSSQSIARLSPSESTYTNFRTHHLLSNTPCILPARLVQHWSIFSHVFPNDHSPDYTYLSTTYGHLPVNCTEMGEEEESIETFGELLDLWKRGRGRDKYLKDWHLPLRIHESAEKGKGKERVKEELYEVLQVCSDDWMNEFEGSREGKGDDFRFVVRNFPFSE